MTDQRSSQPVTERVIASNDEYTYAAPHTSPTNTERSSYAGELDTNLLIVGDTGEGREILSLRMAECDLHANRRITYFGTNDVCFGLTSLYDVVRIGEGSAIPLVHGDGELYAKAAEATRASMAFRLGTNHHHNSTMLQDYLGHMAGVDSLSMSMYFGNADSTIRRKRNRDAAAISNTKTAMAGGFADAGGNDLRWILCMLSGREIPIELVNHVFDVVATRVAKPTNAQALASEVCNPLVYDEFMRPHGVSNIERGDYWIWPLTKRLQHLPKHFRITPGTTTAGRNQHPDRTGPTDLEKRFIAELDRLRKERDAEKAASDKASTKAIKRSGQTSSAKLRSSRFHRNAARAGLSHVTGRLGLGRIALSIHNNGSYVAGQSNTPESILSMASGRDLLPTLRWMARARLNVALRSVVSPDIAGHVHSIVYAQDPSKAEAFFAGMLNANDAHGSMVRARLAKLDAPMLSQERIDALMGMWDAFASHGTAANDDAALAATG